MIEVDVGDAVLGNLRIGISPLWETVASLSLLSRRDACPWPYTVWARNARQALARGRGGEALAWFAGVGLPLPAFLTPAPPPGAAGIDEELAALRAVPEETVREELARRHPSGTPEPFARFARKPREALDWYADLLQDYWAATVAPYWSAMRPVLDQEVLLQARVLATAGGGAVLGRLGGRLRWDRPTLSLNDSSASRRDIRGASRLVLVPLLFARGTPLCATGSQEEVAIAYQARGSAVLAGGRASGAVRQDAEPERGDRLAILVGRGRAAIVRALAVPTTTSVLATTLGLAASTVSEHLTALVAAGVVQRHRIGVRVMYELNRSGRALLEYLDNETVHPAA
ncbi:ArsR/SmtB family transcription factor [Streptosporangium jomthongense]|uniref:ArsR/SmtB family transcription factor n=1 Tax=Streptosporangium jomthongense TaxID=1193683 RepID=A0ABV8ETS7_9ACTN